MPSRTHRRSMRSAVAKFEAAADVPSAGIASASAQWSSRHGWEVLTPGQQLLRLLQPARTIPPVLAPSIAATWAKHYEKSRAPTVTTASPASTPASSPPPSTSRAAFATQKFLSPDAKPFIPGAGFVQHSTQMDQVAVPMAEVNLPAVISVKKSSKGCAVVLLRSRAVLERGVQQSVAVVDGVCIEVRRHTQKYALEEGEEPAMGLFVAWGHRVQRKVSVSAEGLEAYFNALAGAPIPEGLDPKPPFEEASLRFTLSSGSMLPLNCEPSVDVAEKQQLLCNATCRSDLVEQLWHAKGRLDTLWSVPPPPLARSLMSRVARAQLFPHSGVGGKEHENRAGDKLAELSAAVGLLEGVPRGSAFLDLCGGPGAWSQHLLEHGEEMKGFGFTLRIEAGGVEDWQAEEKDQWYPELYQDARWRALWGKDGTGDLLKPGNIQHAAAQLARESVYLVAADGGFSDKAIPPNLLELYFYRLFLGEILMAASCLKKGGRFVCKLYTTLAPATASLLYLLTRMFDHVEIVKPKSSRVTGPERYLACFGFRANELETATIRAALLKAHKSGAGASPLTTPLLSPSVLASDLLRDSLFQQSIRAMSETLCERQAKALEAVVDRAAFLEEMAMSVARSVGVAERPVEYNNGGEDRHATKEPADDGFEVAECSRTTRKNRWNRQDGACERGPGGLAEGRNPQDGWKHGATKQAQAQAQGPKPQDGGRRRGATKQATAGKAGHTAVETVGPR
mmetsp:Transcript_35199/g.101180  ORF Transcript_35199/g.101180 Transcript_35199/m.101180 type:complete len:737 (-) Transcript_35199:101-2311(-)